MVSRAADWFKQAERDLGQAEKAVKALHLHLGQEGQVLDTFCIPSRSPNSHPDGAPFEHYGSFQSEEALRFAGAIIDFVRRRLA